MTNPANPEAVLADLLGVRQPTVLPLEADALVEDVGTVTSPVAPWLPPGLVDSVSVDPTNPHLGILTTSKLTGSEHWASLPEGPLFIQDPTNPHLGILPTLS